jgi:hypothetical protein
VLGDHPGGTRHVAADPADRRDQLSDGVLGGDRIIQDRRVNARRVLPFNAPVPATMAFTASKVRFGTSDTANRRRQ